MLFVIRTSKGYFTQFIRRARGYFPLPLLLETNTDMSVLSMGADLKNTFAFAKKDRVILSQHLGDMADADVFEEYKMLLPYFRGLFEFDFDKIVCDKHPGYFSSRYARQLAKESNIMHIFCPLWQKTPLIVASV